MKVMSAMVCMLTACLCGCAIDDRPAPSLRLSPEQAVMNAAGAPEGVSATFEMIVRGTGRRDGNLYLNSQADYRDPRNLTIVIAYPLADEMSQRFGRPADAFLIHRTIAVKGTARKVRIDFLSDGQPTGKYYFQAQLNLTSERNLTVSGEQPRP